MIERQTAEEMYRRRCAGESLQQIGDENGLSCERIRQIVQQYEQESGVTPSATVLQEQAESRKDAGERKKAERVAEREITTRNKSEGGCVRSLRSSSGTLLHRSIRGQSGHQRTEQTSGESK